MGMRHAISPGWAVMQGAREADLNPEVSSCLGARDDIASPRILPVFILRTEECACAFFCAVLSTPDLAFFSLHRMMLRMSLLPQPNLYRGPRPGSVCSRTCFQAPCMWAAVHPQVRNFKYIVNSSSHFLFILWLEPRELFQAWNLSSSHIESKAPEFFLQ